MQVAASTLLLPLLLSVPALAGGPDGAPTAPAGEVGGPGLALRAAKILTAAEEGPAVIDHGVLLIEDGRIAGVGSAEEIDVPEGWAVEDAGELWLVPGIVDIHTHVASGNALMVNDINDSVFLTNPGLRVSVGVRPQNKLLRRGVGGGVTAALYIPGSGTNISGHGLLLKTGLETYEENLLRDPGSLKLAQAGNPERWCIGVGRSFMNWHTRHQLRCGIAYAEAWEAFEQERGPEPEKDIRLEIFRDLCSKRTQISVHTQVYQVVLATITMLSMELGFDAYIDHGSFDGYRTAALAQEAGVGAMLGPRQIAFTRAGRMDTDGRVLGMAAEYQKRGHTDIAFNTDCVDNGVFITPPLEEVQLQAGMGRRYGMTNENHESLRGLTSVPAKTAGLDHRLGSLEVGKDADVVVISGDPADPRCWVSKVFIEGRVVYDAASEPRRW